MPPLIVSSNVASISKQETRDLAKRFARKISRSGLLLSAADLQGHLMKYKRDPRVAFESVDSQLLAPRRLEPLPSSTNECGAHPSAALVAKKQAARRRGAPPPLMSPGRIPGSE